jgi:hypothetical protein
VGRDGIPIQILGQPDALDHRIKRRQRQREEGAANATNGRPDGERNDDRKIGEP